MNIRLSQLQSIFSYFFKGIIILSTIVMIGIIIPYTSWAWDVDFLLTKQFIIHLDHYRLAFYIHIFSSLLVLFSGVFLFSSFILKNFSRLHKAFGKLYVVLILLLSGPSGLVMAIYANGGIYAKLSFLILTIIWWLCTLLGFLAIKNSNISEHKRWMVRSYALTLSAVSLRIYQLILGYVDIIDPEFQYLFVSWVSWVGNLLVAEFIIKFRNVKILESMNNMRHFYRMELQRESTE